jgi:hypothetical protein
VAVEAGEHIARFLKNYEANFAELAPHLSYHGKQCAKEGPVYGFVESTKRQNE